MVHKRWSSRRGKRRVVNVKGMIKCNIYITSTQIARCKHRVILTEGRVIINSRNSPHSRARHPRGEGRAVVLDIVVAWQPKPRAWQFCSLWRLPQLWQPPGPKTCTDTSLARFSGYDVANFDALFPLAPINSFCASRTPVRQLVFGSF